MGLGNLSQEVDCTSKWHYVWIHHILLQISSQGINRLWGGTVAEAVNVSFIISSCDKPIIDQKHIIQQGKVLRVTKIKVKCLQKWSASSIGNTDMLTTLKNDACHIGGAGDSSIVKKQGITRKSSHQISQLGCINWEN